MSAGGIDSFTPPARESFATTLLERALEGLEREFIAADKGTLFGQLRGFLVADAHTRTYAEAAAQAGMTEEAMKKAVQRLRQRYQQVIRQEIAQTVATPAEIEDELRSLWSALS